MREHARTVAGVPLLVAGVSFLVASLIHTGVAIPLGFTTVRDPFDSAWIPELIIGLVVTAGAATLLAGIRRIRQARRIALLATGFGLFGTLVGLRFTLQDGRPGEVVYHVGILTWLAFCLTLQLVVSGRTPAERSPAAAR